MVKIEIWDLFLKIWVLTALILTVVRGFQTQSFSTNFSKKYFLLKTAQNVSIREKKWSKSKFENFALPMGPWVPDLVIFCRFSKMKILSIFSILAGWICLILHIQVVLMVLDHLTTRNHLTWGQNGAKWGQLCRKNVKILILDYFFEFECLNMLDIVGSDSSDCSFPYDNHELPGLRA